MGERSLPQSQVQRRQSESHIGRSHLGAWGLGHSPPTPPPVLSGLEVTRGLPPRVTRPGAPSRAGVGEHAAHQARRRGRMRPSHTSFPVPASGPVGLSSRPAWPLPLASAACSPCRDLEVSARAASSLSSTDLEAVPLTPETQDEGGYEVCHTRSSPSPSLEAKARAFLTSLGPRDPEV